MRWYAVVCERTQASVEVFETRLPAERFIARVRTDDPLLASLLRVELIELGSPALLGSTDSSAS